MRVPKYRVRSDRDTAYVEMDGQRISLPGLANSAESKEAYRRALNDYLRRHAKAKADGQRPVWAQSVADLVMAWLDHCQAYYAHTANTRSNTYDNCCHAVRPLLVAFGGLPVADFGPEELRQVRDVMIRGGWHTESMKKPASPWARTYVNGQANKLKLLFRWGLERGLVPPENQAMIAAVPPLKKGRTLARETPAVEPVSEEVVAATLPHLPTVVRAMVELHRLTGMRSDNLCSMRPMDIDRSGDVWIYRPAVHKGSHDERSLSVPLGPRCQEILRPYLLRPADSPCFSPRTATARTAKKHGRRAPGTRYTTGTYRNAIRRVCLKHDIPLWHPHQLRHVAADAAKRACTLDGARAYLGHTMVSTTEIYETRDLELACEVARRIG